METSIDEGLETEGEAEEDPSQAFDAFQSTRGGQRRHTLSEVTNQLVVVPGSGMISSKHRGSLCSILCCLLQEIVVIPASSWNVVCVLFLCGQHSAGVEIRPAPQLTEIKLECL